MPAVNETIPSDPRRLAACCLLVFAVSVDLNAAADIPRTEEGRPNLDGIWYYGSATPFERPAELGTKKTYTEAEAVDVLAALRRADAEWQQPSDPDRPPPKRGAEIDQSADRVFTGYRDNLTRIDGRYRTSLIVEPADGRLPYRDGAMDIFDEWLAEGFGAYDNPEIRPASERCLSVVAPMAPMVGWWYNANMRIVQTPGHLMLQGEMHTPRIIDLTGETEPPGLPRWFGQSRGHWDGDALVIRTDRFRPEGSWFFFKYSDELEVEERLELISENEIKYRYTAKDPKIFTSPVTVEMSITRRPPQVRQFEFACHEANYSLEGVLRGARVLELESAQAEE
jgi:hypothetical protein